MTPQPHELFFSWKMSWVACLYTCFMQANGDLFIFFFHFFSCPIWVHGGAHGGAGFCTFTTPHCATPHHLCPKTPLWCPLRPTRLKIILHTRIYQVFWFFKYFGHFCHFWAFGGRSPPKKWPSAHRIQGSIWGSQPIPPTPQRLLTFGTPYFYDQGSDLIISEEWQNTTTFFHLEIWQFLAFL